MEALRAIALPPGFGFHPTDVELISHYLKRKNIGLTADVEVIPELDIYKLEPWDMPSCCQIPTRDSKWHFFTSRDRKYPNGTRSNRATEAGYWKSTGKDRTIRCYNRVIGAKKTLVFHEGRPPCGRRTDWIMHEFSMNEKECKMTHGLKDTYVLCRVTKRNGLLNEDENLSEQTGEIASLKAVKCSLASPNEGAEQNELSMSESTEDLDSWLKELFDPNFDGFIDLNFNCPPIPIEPKRELQTKFSTLIPKDEPLEFGFLPEEIISILREDVTAMPEIAELMTDDRRTVISVNPEINFSSNDLSLDPNYNALQIRERRHLPTSRAFLRHHIKLQVETSKMESRKSQPVYQTIKCAQLNRCISSKVEDANNISNKSAKQSCTTGIIGEFWSIFSWCSATCMIGAAALIIYLVFSDFTLALGKGNWLCVFK